jgi:hypothetical protein
MSPKNKDVQVMRAVFWEQSSNQRVGHSFEGAVRIGEDEHAPEEVVVSIFRAAGTEGNKG